MLKLPPGRFSMTIGWPRFLRNSSASAQTKMSLVPPALVVLMMRIGFAG